MKLTYRSIDYDWQALDVELSEGEVGGKYRGQDWRYRYLKQVPELHPRLMLTYRGVSYGKRPAVKNPQPKTPGSAVDWFVRDEKLAAVREATARVHRDNIRRRLEHRLTIAKAKGNQELIQMLEDEARQLGLDIAQDETWLGASTT